MLVNMFQPLSATDLPKLNFAAFLVLCHGFDTNVLHASSIIAVCKIAGLLMQKITALIGDLLMKHGHAQSLLFPVASPLLPFGQFPLCPGQPFFCFSQEIGIYGIILVRSDIQTVHGKIQLEKFLRHYEEHLIFVLHQNAYVV